MVIPCWKMSARAVLTYITGGKAGSMTVTPKYIGHRRLVEIAISTLVTDRSLLLLGEQSLSFFLQMPGHRPSLPRTALTP